MHPVIVAAGALAVVIAVVQMPAPAPALAPQGVRTGSVTLVRTGPADRGLQDAIVGFSRRYGPAAAGLAARGLGYDAPLRREDGSRT